jgi:galactitol-specific phosphotransferase system IIB component
MKKILFICGSLNQTTQMHQIARHLTDHYCYFTPYYGDGLINTLTRAGLLDFTILGGPFRHTTERYFQEHLCPIDYEGKTNNYDLVVTCSDLIVQKNIREKKIILVQEGMTDPENIVYHLVKRLGMPRYLASTSTTGLSNVYHKFCVASEGYRDLFIGKGVSPEKIVVTGIPNFDNARQYLHNDFPHRNYVLVATSDARETFKFDNRRAFLKKALEIAGDRQIIFKLHPNENVRRSSGEIKKFAPHALIFHDGNAHHMVANCNTLITQYSSLAFTGIALDKEVHSYFDGNLLKQLTPVQNGGNSSKNIADVCRSYLQ